MKEIILDNVVVRITKEIEELEKMNGKRPTMLTVAEDIKQQILQQEPYSTQNKAELTEFQGLKVNTIPSNTLLNWVLT